jgi:hypothetical protein
VFAEQKTFVPIVDVQSLATASRTGRWTIAVCE